MIALLLALTGGPSLAGRAALPPGDADRGAHVADLAGCAACHTAEGGTPYAGGHRVETPFGVFVGTNLTPDPTHGLGTWTVDDFAKAVRHGIGPDGTRYWPAFPFPAFTGLSDADVADLWAYLQTLPPSDRANEPHEVDRGRWQLRFWRPLAFHPRGAFEPDPDQSDAWNRGAYLVRHVGHCGECHTPRGGIGGTRDKRFLGGSDLEPEPGPNLTSHPDALGGWSVSDWTTFMELGMTAEGDFVGGEMGRVVEEGTARLSPEDRRAMAEYLVTVPPVAPPGAKGGEDPVQDDEGDDW